MSTPHIRANPGDIARKETLKFAAGNVRSGDTFYSENEEWTKPDILTVSDELHTGLAAEADEQRYSFANMMSVAPETALAVTKD